MEIRLYFQMLKRGWWLIVCAALAAVSISLALSYVAIPQYRSAARLIISPNSTVSGSADVVRSLDTLDRASTVSTYAEVASSNRIYEQTLSTLQVKPGDLLAYTRSAVVLPSSSVLEVAVSGPNPQVTAQLANAISWQTILYSRGMNQVYKVDILDTAGVPSQPVSPQPLRDGAVALVLGLAVGALLAILREQIQTPFDALRARLQIDPASSAYNRAAFQRHLEEMQARNQENVGLGLIHLDGLSGVIESLPPNVSQRLLQHITSQFRRELRGNDWIGRWGPIQYGVILPSTPLHAAELTLGRIQRALSGPVQLEQVDAPISLRPYVGVAVSAKQESAAVLIDRAEKELGQARQRHLADAENSGTVSLA